MINAFDPEVAIDVGIMAAILYKNIQHWCEFNKTNEKNFYNGLYWTFNSARAFKEQFPYMSEKQIRTSLETLEEKGYIKTGNFNKVGYDRTKWYADTGKGNSICPTGKMELPYKENGISQEGEPIPNNNTDINTNGITPYISPVVSPAEKRKLLFKEFWDAYPKCKRKVDYDGCEKAFIKIKDLENIFPDIMASLELWKKDWSKDNFEYVPTTHKWITKKYWEVKDMRTELQQRIDEATEQNISGFLF